jgi:hypothetical protein
MRLVLLNAFPLNAFPHRRFAAEFERVSLAELTKSCEDADEVVNFIRHPATVAALQRTTNRELNADLERGEAMSAIVVHDLYNSYRQTYACLAEIVPLSQVKYRLVSRYWGGKVEDGFVEQGLEELYLSAPRRRFVEYSLRLQGYYPYDFVEPVTVHDEWKVKKHQGIAFARRRWSVATGKWICTRPHSEEDAVEIGALIRDVLEGALAEVKP